MRPFYTSPGVPCSSQESSATETTYAGADFDDHLWSFEQAAVAGYFLQLSSVLVRASYLSDAPPGEEFVRRAVMLIRPKDLSGALGVEERIS